MPLADIRSQYARLAAGYDRRWGRYTARAVEGTLAGLVLDGNERTLDVGSGTGALLESLLARAPRLRAVGLDASDAMLAQARRRLPARVPLLVGDVHALPFADGAFSLIVSASSFHFWEDKPAALAELRRVLAPGGRLVLTDWCDDYLACRLCDRVLRVMDRAHAPIVGGRQCEAALRAAGLRVTGLRRYRASWPWGLMTATASREPPGFPRGADA